MNDKINTIVINILIFLLVISMYYNGKLLANFKLAKETLDLCSKNTKECITTCNVCLDSLESCANKLIDCNTKKGENK